MLLEFSPKFATEKVRITARPTDGPDGTGNPTTLKGPLLVTPSGPGTFVQTGNESFECISDTIGDTTYDITYPSDPTLASDQVLVHFLGSDALSSNLFGEVLPK